MYTRLTYTQVHALDSIMGSVLTLSKGCQRWHLSINKLIFFLNVFLLSLF